MARRAHVFDAADQGINFVEEELDVWSDCEGSPRFFRFELLFDASVKSFIFANSIELKDARKLDTEDIVFILSNERAADYRKVLKLTRGEAIHWLLLSAKRNQNNNTKFTPLP